MGMRVCVPYHARTHAYVCVPTCTYNVYKEVYAFVPIYACGVSDEESHMRAFEHVRADKSIKQPLSGRAFYAKKIVNGYVCV